MADQNKGSYQHMTNITHTKQKELETKACYVLQLRSIKFPGTVLGTMWVNKGDMISLKYILLFHGPLAIAQKTTRGPQTCGWEPMNSILQNLSLQIL